MPSGINPSNWLLLKSRVRRVTDSQRELASRIPVEFKSERINFFTNFDPV